MKFSDLTSKQKAAAVIVSLGTENASSIYKYLDQDEIERLTVEVAQLGHLTAELTEDILDDFYKDCVTQKVVTDGGMEYAKTVLQKAFGESTANNLLDRVNRTLQARSFGFIQRSDTKSLYSILARERAQTIALVLSYVDSEQAASIIAELPESKRLRVVEAIARMESASPEAIKIVEEEIKKKFSGMVTADFTNIGGVDYIADVINHMDRGNEKYIFDELGKKDGNLAEKIRQKMFVFEDIADMDSRSIQRFVRECDMRDLVYAMKSTSSQIKEVIFANMSSRMAESVQADLEITVNVRLRDVEEAQQRIVAKIRELEEAGEIILNKGGKDELIV